MSENQVWAVVEVFGGVPEAVRIARTKEGAELLAKKIARENELVWDDEDGFWRSGDYELHVRPAQVSYTLDDDPRIRDLADEPQDPMGPEIDDEDGLSDYEDEIGDEWKEAGDEFQEGSE